MIVVLSFFSFAVQLFLFLGNSINANNVMDGEPADVPLGGRPSFGLFISQFPRYVVLRMNSCLRFSKSMLNE